jgi:hypothetical protein
MPNKIKPKRSYTANAVPVVSGNTPDIEQHEMAVNWTDGKIFTRDVNNQLVSITLGGSGSIPTATASVLGGVKVGSGLTITDGVLAASGGGSLSGSVTIPGLGDPYYSSVALLLHMNGTGSTFVDSSPSPKTITAVGNATQSTAQPKWGAKSAAFDGSGDALTVAMPAIGTGDFAIEMWVYLLDNTASYTGLYDGRSGDTTAHPVLYIGSGVLSYYVTTANRITGPTVSANAWHHIALARSSGTTRMYLDGQQVGSPWSDSTDYLSSSAAYIGSLYNAGSVNGYIDDVRVTIGGFARGYTGSSILVPTAAFPDSADLTVPVTITGSGGGGGSGLSWSSVPASATASGTAGQIAYDGSYFYVAVGSNQWERAALSTWATDPSFSNVSLLLHMDGLGSAFVDSSGTPKTITTSGNATQSAAQSVFGGRSAYFDGSGDSIQTPTVGQSALQFSNQLHTVEFWFRTNSTTQYTCLFYRGREGVEAAYDYVININNVSSSSGDIYLFSLGLGGAALGSSINGLNDNNWHHLAVCRDSGNVIRMYIDGVQRASMTYDMTQSYSANSDSIIRIGRDGVLTGRDFIGNIDELRITTGVCRYPNGTTFTPPTAPFPDA